MSRFVGHSARVSELVGVDDRGCAGVHVDVDGGEWFWRVRDFSPTETALLVAYVPGLASDHGRAAAEDASTEVDPRVPQACGMTDASAQYGPVRVGTEVILGRHRPVDGEDNWIEQMVPYIGRRTRVVQLIGVDDQGCPLLQVDIDRGDWLWRLRDVQLPD